MAVNRPTRRGSDLLDKVALFNKKVEQHNETQLANPFSNVDKGSFSVKKMDKNDPNYGRPVAGSLTAQRGEKAKMHLNKELRELCEVIYDLGIKPGDGRAVVTFGELFQMYNIISDKCVGLCLIARKHGYITFPGEMLFQRRDEDTEIALTKPIEEILKCLPISYENGQLVVNQVKG